MSKAHNELVAAQYTALQQNVIRETMDREDKAFMAADAPYAKQSKRVEEVRVVDEKTGGEKGSKLARFDLIPWDAIWEIAEVFGLGARKYADRNWERGYKWGLSVAALHRHLKLRLDGQVRDEETGARHMAQVAWHAIVLLTFELRGLGTDDVTLHSKPLRTREQLEGLTPDERYQS